MKSSSLNRCISDSLRSVMRVVFPTLVLLLTPPLAAQPMIERIEIPCHIGPSEVVTRSAAIFAQKKCRVTFADAELGAITAEYIDQQLISRDSYLYTTTIFHLAFAKGTLFVTIYCTAVASGSVVFKSVDGDVRDPIVERLWTFASTPYEIRE